MKTTRYFPLLFVFLWSSVLADIAKWDVRMLTKSTSDFSILRNSDGRDVYRANIPRLKRIVDVLRQLEVESGSRSRLWLAYSDSGETNAFAVRGDDGNHIFLTTGLVDLLGEDMDAVAFVLAHEIAHIVKEHGLQKKYLAELMASLRRQEDHVTDKRAASFQGFSSELTAAIYGLAFSRDQERQADSLAMAYIISSGFDPRGGVRAQRALMGLSSASLTPLLRSHPVDSERLSYLQNLTKQPVSYARLGRSAATNSAIQSEEASDMFSSTDKNLARIAEALAVIGREFVAPIDSARLIKGCSAEMNALTTFARDIPSPTVQSTAKGLGEFISITQHNFPEVDITKLVDACINGMARSTDRFSEWFGVEEVKGIPSQVFGIGVELRLQDDLPVIIVPIPGSPAERAGLSAWDQIVAIDGKATSGLPLKQVVRLLRGSNGSTANLLIIHEGGDATPRTISVKREPVTSSAIASKHLGNSVGYVRIRGFYEDTVRQFVDVLTRFRNLEEGPVNTIILDLRFNSGGLLKTSMGIATLLLQDDRLIAISRGRHADSRGDYVAHTEYLSSLADPAAVKNIMSFAKSVEVFVLVNDETASGAEVLAAALQDHKRATIVGTRTKGVGIVSGLLPLKFGGFLKITQGLLLRSNGDVIADVGVIPDVTLTVANLSSTGTGDELLAQVMSLMPKGQPRRSNE